MGGKEGRKEIGKGRGMKIYTERTWREKVLLRTRGEEKRRRQEEKNDQEIQDKDRDKPEKKQARARNKR